MLNFDEAWLLLETSGRGGLVGLAYRGNINQIQLDPARRHNRDLTSSCAKLLEQADLAVKQLGGVMVSLGPGSFTGLRVGIMSAKVLAYAVGCPLIAVPTFPTIAWQSPPECHVVDVLSDGLQGLVYRQRFRRSGLTFQAVNELQITKATDWVNTLRAEVWVSGPGVAVVEKLMPEEQPRVALERRTPGLSGIFEVGKALPAVSQSELMQLEPLYLRPSSAEEQAARKANAST